MDTRTAVWVSTAEKNFKIVLGGTENFPRKFRGSQRQLRIKTRPLTRPISEPVSEFQGILRAALGVASHGLNHAKTDSESNPRSGSRKRWEATRAAFHFSENSRRLWLFMGSLQEFWRKVPGKFRENCWKNVPESRNAINSRFQALGKANLPETLGSHWTRPCADLPCGTSFEIDSSSLLEFL